MYSFFLDLGSITFKCLISPLTARANSHIDIILDFKNGFCKTLCIFYVKLLAKSSKITDQNPKAYRTHQRPFSTHKYSEILDSLPVRSDLGSGK